MKRKKFKGIKKATAIILTASLMLVSTGCGNNVGESTDLSGTPGGGKWVDSDIIGAVKAEDDIRLQDDFAAAVNREYMISEIPENSLPEKNSRYAAAELIGTRFKELLDDSSVKGANAEKLRTFRALLLDWDERNRLGIEPLKKYISYIEEISSVDGLTEYQGSPEKNPFGLGFLMPKDVEAQLQYPDRSTLALKAPTFLLGSKEAYINFDASALQAKERADDQIYYFLNRAGYSDKDIKAILKGNYKIETFLARNVCDDMYSAVEEFNIVQNNRAGLSDYAGDYPLFEILDGRGYAKCDSFHVDCQYLSSLSSIYDEAHLDDIKAFFTVHTINEIKYYLDREAFEKILGSSDFNDEDVFIEMLPMTGFSPAMSTLYLEKYFSDDKKIDEIKTLTDNLIAAYKKMIGEEDWLSEETKAAAIVKLDNMAVKIVRPDNTADYSDADIKPYTEGGTLVDAVAQAKLVVNAHTAKKSGEPKWDRNFWDIYNTGIYATTDVNCVYYPNQNAIYITAGWTAISDVLFGDDISYEQLAGSIGSVIGHEISHGFDSHGSKFDLNGCAYDDNGDQIDWMSMEDRAHLDERAAKVAGYFTLARPIPGQQKVNGENVKDEAIADMGGIKALLYMAKDIPDFDHDAFFRAYAALWAEQTTEQMELAFIQTDEHPLAFYRINITLQQFDEFIETYDIKPGDGMYLAPESRVNVW